MIKCSECEGDGFIWDHTSWCDGTCDDGECPVQIPCPNQCRGGWTEE